MLKTDTAINSEKLGGKFASEYALKENSVSSVNGKTGAVSLSASDVGALPVSGTAVNSEKFGGKAPEYYVQPRNLLDNSYFVNPVNQRGQTSYTGKSYAYTLDRWLISNENTVINLLDNGIELDNTNNSNDVDFYQKLPILLNDGIYTFVINTTDGMVYCCASVSGTTITNISKVSIDTISASIMYTDGLKFYVKGSVKGGSVSTILWAALYEGSYTADILPPYAPKGYSAELAECRRYYLLAYWYEFDASDSRREQPFSYPMPMAIDTPTLNVSGDYYNGNDWVPIPPENIITTDSGMYCARIRINNINAVVRLRIEASADL